jgi:putative dimethyl sulfoxide reductase chaperone
MNSDPQELGRLYAGLAHSLLQAPTDDPAAEREYYRLFLSPEGAPCPPWQSIYMAAEGEQPRLMGPAHHSALQWYRRYGFEPVLENEPADHIGLLLLFYARLLTADTPESELAAFEAQHLAWVPRFTAKLDQHAGHPRFRELSAELAKHL